MPKRKRKQYSRPKNPYNKVRIKEEAEIIKKYGLKNKKEIWKADTAIGKIRKQAKKLITANEEKKQTFLAKLKKIGFKVNDIAEVLSLKKEDWLTRRLQTVIFNLGLATTPKQARQFITHKLISVNGKTMNIPSYMVKFGEEKEISLDKSIKIAKKKEKKVEGEKDEE